MRLEQRVAKKVRAVLSAFSQVSEEQITDKVSLTYDLGITKTEKRFLAKPFTRISNAEGGERVTRAKCGKLSTVKKAIELVVKQAKKS